MQNNLQNNSISLKYVRLEEKRWGKLGRLDEKNEVVHVVTSVRWNFG